MLKFPEVNMKVKLVDPECCHSSPDDDNHAGNGTIIEITEGDIDCNLVRMDKYPDEEWWRCHHCIEVI